MEMADDLISRSELRAAAIKATAIFGYEPSEFSFDNCYPYWQFSKCIKDAPAVDAVPVVRCRDCVHFGECLVTENDYCSKGERKETD